MKNPIVEQIKEHELTIEELGRCEDALHDAKFFIIDVEKQLQSGKVKLDALFDLHNASNRINDLFLELYVGGKKE